MAEGPKFVANNFIFENIILKFILKFDDVILFLFFITDILQLFLKICQSVQASYKFRPAMPMKVQTPEYLTASIVNKVIKTNFLKLIPTMDYFL